MSRWSGRHVTDWRVEERDVSESVSDIAAERTEAAKLDAIGDAVGQSFYLSSQGMSEWPTLEECIQAGRRAVREREVADLVAEVERHRRANLVRAVTEGFDEWIGEAVNAEDWDAVPWRVAEELRNRLAAVSPQPEYEPLGFVRSVDTDPEDLLAIVAVEEFPPVGTRVWVRSEDVQP